MRKGVGGFNYRYGFELDLEVVLRLKLLSIGERDYELGCLFYFGYFWFIGEYLVDLVERKFYELRVFIVLEFRLVIKNFLLNNKIGEGGFGFVYKGVIKYKFKF